MQSERRKRYQGLIKGDESPVSSEEARRVKKEFEIKSSVFEKVMMIHKTGLTNIYWAVRFSSLLGFRHPPNRIILQLEGQIRNCMWFFLVKTDIRFSPVEPRKGCTVLALY